VYYGEAMIDDDGHRFKDIHIRAKVTKRGSDLEVDLTDCHEEVDGFINSAYPNTRSAVVVALSYLIDPETPKNDGTFRPISVVTREGTIVHPRPGKPVTLSTNCCGQEIIEAIVKALAPACPDRAMAGWGRRFRIAIQGVDPRTRRPFIWHLFQARPGGGASPAGDGWPGAGEWQAAGGIKFGSLEVAEVRFPLFFRRHQFRPDSGGDGRYRGGPGGDLEFAVEVAEPGVANTAGDGVKYGACGILGGQDGRPHHYVLRPAAGGGEERTLRTKEVGIPIRPGDVIVARSGGGGGWGDPAGRGAEERARDRRLGFVTDGTGGGGSA
jgi:N-methylhydantoinase B